MLLSTVFAFLSRFLCHTTCHDVPITKHDIFQWFDRETSDNYVLKIANGQLVELFVFFCFCFFFLNPIHFPPLFLRFFSFSFFFRSPPTLSLICLSAELTMSVVSPAADGLRTRGGWKEMATISVVTAGFCPYCVNLWSSAAHYYTANWRQLLTLHVDKGHLRTAWKLTSLRLFEWAHPV